MRAAPARRFLLLFTLAGSTLAPAVAGQAGPAPEQQVAMALKAFLARDLESDWGGVERLPGITWAPLPPTALQNCLPDGSCFARQGRATIAGRNLAVIATGARTIVTHLYLRNGSAPFGDAKVLEALGLADVTADLARCPIPGQAGGTSWYRLKGPDLNPGVLAIQTTCSGRACEGFVLSQGEELPALQPNQLSLYSEQCGAGVARTPVSTLKPHERLAEVVAALLAPASGPAGHEWKALTGLPTDITWNEGPRRTDLSVLYGDPNPFSLTGSTAYAGRKFSVTASGTETRARNIYLEEQGMHPRGEHMLGVVYQKGIAVRLVRCGPIYTESTNNWYSLTSSGTRPAMIRQSIRYEGNQVQDSYALRLDGTLPARDPRDRDPGVNGCQ